MAILAFRLDRDRRNGYDVNLDALLTGPDVFDADLAAQAYAEGYKKGVRGAITIDHVNQVLETLAGDDDEVDPRLGKLVGAYMDTMVQVEQIEQPVE
jgi:hypothetical protein